jgi:hypothetical protein
VHSHAISKNHGVPKRSISPNSFDAILSELGEDPAIGHLTQRPSPSIPESQAMNRHSYEADANRLSEQFPHHNSHQTDPMQAKSSPLLHKLHHSTLLQEKPVWLAIALCILGASLTNTYFLFELHASQRIQPAAIDETGHGIREIKELIVNLTQELEGNQDELISILESVENIAMQNNKAMRARAAQGPHAPQNSPAEQALKRWRYLGMSNSTSGLTGVFDAGEGMRHIALNSPAVEGWHLSSITRELASFTSSAGKTRSISISKE